MPLLSLTQSDSFFAPIIESYCFFFIIFAPTIEMEILSKNYSTIHNINYLYSVVFRLDSFFFGKIAMESVTQREAPKSLAIV